MKKSSTDIHWNERAIGEQDHELVNIADVSQREIETSYILRHINSSDNLLEVGCGNGFLTNILRDKVKNIDAFDYSENMIEQAVSIYGETNNRFFHDNLLEPEHTGNSYDAIVCVRVLINLRNFEEQEKALENLTSMLRKGGRLILIEGFSEGFDSINLVRESMGMEKLSPASINYYSKFSEFKKLLEGKYEFDQEHSFDTGFFDFLTRVVYPAAVGEKNATGHSEFHSKIMPLINEFGGQQFKNLSRLVGLSLTKV